MRQLFAILVLLSTVTVTAHADRHTDKRLRLTFEYRDGASAKPISSFYYFNTSFRLDHDYISFEVDTVIWPIIIDAVAGGFKWLAGNGFDLPVYQGLNDNGSPGHMRLFHGAVRYNPIRQAPNWVGVGLSTQVTEVSLMFSNKELSVVPLDLGINFELRKQLSTDSEVGVAATAGNGWTRYAGFNPTYGVAAWADIKLHRVVGGFVRTSWKRQRLDLTSYSDTDPQLDPSEVQSNNWVSLWSVDVGVSLSF